MVGSVTNNRPGPAPTSSPYEKQAGMITSAATTAAMVSNKAVCWATSTTSSFLERYAPYTIMPLPVTESEKNACPMAQIQIMGSASISQRGWNIKG